MSKSDEIDRRRAAAYAWRFLAPGEGLAEAADLEMLAGGVERDDVAAGDPASLERADAGNEEPGVMDDAAREALQALCTEAIRECGALADSVDRIWSFTDEGAQVDAMDALLAQAVELGLKVVAMQHHPMQSIRLLRLAVRHYGRLSTTPRLNFRFVAMWLDYDHPELFELLAEIARGGYLEMIRMLRMAIDSRTRFITRHADAGARLARMLDQAQTVRERYIVLGWLDFAAGPETVGSLRRMLRQPCFSLRYHALCILNRSLPHAITADDLMFLLEDAVVHVPPFLASESSYEAHYGFPNELADALVRLRPAGGHTPLERIVDGDCAGTRYDSGLDDTWALCMLAAVYPERAVARIDQLFRRVNSDSRYQAVRAAGHLPDELAWPRLLAAAADGTPAIVEHAQQTWLTRRGSLCPVDELAGVEVGLLDAPPSDRMRSRLMVLRTGSREVRAAMIEVLLGEAPDPEALVLLLFAGADADMLLCKLRPGLPSSRFKLCAAIITGFGVRGVQGLYALHDRYPEGSCGWLHSISSCMAEQHEVPEAVFPALRAGAMRCLSEMPDRDKYEPMIILTRVGAPPELFTRLWSSVRDMGKQYRVERAADVLATMPANDEHDRVIAAEMEAALAASELPRFVRAATVGLRRGLPGAVPMVERVLEDYGPTEQDDLDITDMLTTCVSELLRLERMPEEWFTAGLAQPGTQAFAVAARQMPADLTPETIAVVRAALGATSHAAAAEAAIALIQLRTGDVTDPIIADIAVRAPLRLSAKLVRAMAYHKALPRSLWPLIERLLTTSDPNVAESMRWYVHSIADNQLEQELLAVGPKILDPGLRSDYEEWSGFRKKVDDYWQDVELEPTKEEKAARAELRAELEADSKEREAAETETAPETESAPEVTPDG